MPTDREREKVEEIVQALTAKQNLDYDRILYWAERDDVAQVIAVAAAIVGMAPFLVGVAVGWLIWG